jgi:hypothetical protein
MCRFKLPTDSPGPELTDRVRPASSAPARPSGTSARRIVFGESSEATGPPDVTGDRSRMASPVSVYDQGPYLHGAAPVLWTSGQRRPDSAANPATWPRHKLEGVLEAAGVSHQHCNDHSSLVEMVVMCLRDYTAAGARYDGARSLQQQPPQPQPPPPQQQQRASEIVAHAHDDTAFMHGDASDHRDKTFESRRRALPPFCADRAGGEVAMLNSTSSHQPQQQPQAFRSSFADYPRCLLSQRGGWAACERGFMGDGEARRPGPLMGRGSDREIAAMARGGRLEELSRSIWMAGAAQATRARCADIRRERQLESEEDLLRRMLHQRERQRERGRQRETAIDILEARHEAQARPLGDSLASDPPPPPPPPPLRVEGMVTRPSLAQTDADGSCFVRPVGGSVLQASASGHRQCVHGDFGWDLDPGRRSTGNVGRTGDGEVLRPACVAGDWDSSSLGGVGSGRGSSAVLGSVGCHAAAAAAGQELEAAAAGLRCGRSRASRASLVLKVAAGKDRTLFE